MEQFNELWMGLKYLNFYSYGFGCVTLLVYGHVYQPGSSLSLCFGDFYGGLSRRHCGTISWNYFISAFAEVQWTYDGRQSLQWWTLLSLSDDIFSRCQSSLFCVVKQLFYLFLRSYNVSKEVGKSSPWDCTGPVTACRTLLWVLDLFSTQGTRETKHLDSNSLCSGGVGHTINTWKKNKHA